MVVARDPDEVVAAIERVERRVNADGLTAAGFVCYEAASGFDAALTTQHEHNLPLVCFGLFAQVEECESPIKAESGSEKPWRLDTQHHEYLADIVKIRELIAAGEVYQINHTLRLNTELSDARQHFCQIAADAPFAAFIETDDFAIISASPELFFRLQGNDLQSRPMKGTEARRDDPEADKRTSNWLGSSQKNRAENLMITDMVRNDLGKIAETGSVDVSGLFAVEAYPTVWQMTSTVHAKTPVSLVDIFRTLFPAASITGAPNRAAMGQIAKIEKTPRGIYTGAIGYIAPNRQAQFSIAIRTSTVDKVAGSAQYGAGGGIVWDSTPVQEYVEMQAKTRILGTLQEQENIELFETLRWTPGEGFSRLQRHLRRMAKSAAVFGYSVDEQRAEAALQQAVNGSTAQALRVRLSLTVEGDYRVDLAELPSDTQSRNSQPICLATTPVCSTDLYLIHKTSHRQVYDRATTEVPAGAEPILFNEQGEITESSIANVVYTLGDDWFTPPVESGLLPGILREELLEQGKVKVRKLALDELDEVTEIQLINDLRGWRRAHWK